MRASKRNIVSSALFVISLGCGTSQNPNPEPSACPAVRDAAGTFGSVYDGGTPIDVSGLVGGSRYVAIDAIATTIGPTICATFSPSGRSLCSSGFGLTIADFVAGCPAVGAITPPEGSQGYFMFSFDQDVPDENSAITAPITFIASDGCLKQPGIGASLIAYYVDQKGSSKPPTSGWVSITAINPTVEGSLDITFGDTASVSGRFYARPCR